MWGIRALLIASIEVPYLTDERSTTTFDSRILLWKGPRRDPRTPHSGQSSRAFLASHPPNFTSSLSVATTTTRDVFKKSQCRYGAYSTLSIINCAAT